MEGPSWRCCLDFNGGGYDLEFPLVCGSEAELGEDLMVRFGVGVRYSVVAG